MFSITNLFILPQNLTKIDVYTIFTPELRGVASTEVTFKNIFLHILHVVVIKGNLPPMKN